MFCFCSFVSVVLNLLSTEQVWNTGGVQHFDEVPLLEYQMLVFGWRTVGLIKFGEGGGGDIDFGW